jgi:3-deoxy-manno-octulosonate cytidylyltransferase (CMP-KDO synthetase)
MLAGEPLITRVIQRVQEHGLVDELVVATDAPEVAQVVERSRVRVVLTSSRHLTGTDRVAEVAGKTEFAKFDAILNVQGDEPFVSREAVAGAIARVAQGDDIGTAAAPLDPALVDDPARVKVVTDGRSRALYFSRAAIPHLRDERDIEPGTYWQHLGVYAYTRETLRRWSSLEPSPAELAERLEQLRALHHGLRIGVALLAEAVEPGVDTPDDLRRAEAQWHALQR